MMRERTIEFLYTAADRKFDLAGAFGERCTQCFEAIGESAFDPRGAFVECGIHLIEATLECDVDLCSALFQRRGKLAEALFKRGIDLAGALAKHGIDLPSAVGERCFKRFKA
jgi:hypothetical protein